MLRTTSILFALLLASPALAHPGHLAGLAGHDHWVAGAAIGLAVLVGIWGAVKGGKKSESEVESDAEGSEDEEEVAA